ncbi:hypothetical protein PYCCODRAFT_1434395 [Trametes coccinea BRFM310]|uniref:Protein kinase domain-containing protein n=1 Tax=Trametes coccinea (strain BRFM310) TaxID=1353009 RepID=A0A1Y2IQT8_TRAC3|nr:hypothetical protein PYCCODRAFT_1434395 [Trametes coccinea BRFM310]
MLSFLSSWILPSSRRSDLTHHHTQRGAELKSSSFNSDDVPDYPDPVQPGHGADSSFLSVLTAPYEPLAPPPRIVLPPKPPISSVNQLHATVAWSDPEPEEDGSGSESEDDEEMDISELPEQARESLDQPAYQPVAKFSWTTGLPLSGSKLLYNIHVEPPYTLSIMRGKIGDRDMTYLCKRWWRAARSSWRGFYAELKLFSSPVYLRDMQGCGIPYLINLYSSADAISFVMALPHQSFWIEASADMPNELKKQVIITYIALHARGVLHGSPELHNMLVGGDGRVTLIDFHAARARNPIPELGIEAVTRAELDLELRQVMFKLDYEGARKREYARMKRLQPLWARLDECARQGLPLEKIPINELRDPPPSQEHWRRDWINSLNGPPRRFIAPGQTPEEYRQASATFCKMLEDWHELEKKDAVSPLIYALPSSPPHSRAASPVPPASPTPSSSAVLPPPASAPEANPRKRKKESGPDDTPPPFKRSRGADLPDGSIPPPPRYERKTTSYDTGEAVKLLPAAATTKSESKAGRVRDFAYEPYDGPRGYYFPHPPTEARRDMMRIVHIRNENAIACGEEGLPYYRLDRGLLSPPAFKRCLVKGLHVARGTLKRQRDEAEHPVSLSQQQRAKKQRFEDDRRAALSEDRIVWFNDTVSYQDPPREEDYERGPAGSTSSATVPRSHKPSASTARPRRSILKPTRPVKTVSYNLAKWGGQASLDAGLSFYTAKSPYQILAMQQTRPTTQDGDSQLAGPSNASDKPVQQPSGSGAVDAQPGSGAPSEGLSQTRLESTVTNEISVAAESPALDGHLMVRASDVAPATRDLRSNTALKCEGGSCYDRVSSLETHDLKEELEVEAILVPRDE